MRAWDDSGQGPPADRGVAAHPPRKALWLAIPHLTRASTQLGAIHMDGIDLERCKIGVLAD